VGKTTFSKKNPLLPILANQFVWRWRRPSSERAWAWWVATWQTGAAPRPEPSPVVCSAEQSVLVQAWALLQADGAEKGRLRAQSNELYKVVYSEKLGEMASEFDRVHSVHRAPSVGALNYIIPPANLRPYVIDAVERGMRSEDKASEKAELEIVEAA
jgi:hypothetical protein